MLFYPDTNSEKILHREMRSILDAAFDKSESEEVVESRLA